MDSDTFGTAPSHTRAHRGGSVDSVMNEARAVLQRLRRIEALESGGAPVRSVLAEVHALLTEAEAWASCERAGTDLAEEALERCRDALEGRADQGLEAVSR
jgi:hypothetical protein